VLKQGNITADEQVTSISPMHSDEFSSSTLSLVMLINQLTSLIMIQKTILLLLRIQMVL